MKKRTEIVQVYSCAVVFGCETHLVYSSFHLSSLFCIVAPYQGSECDSINANCLVKTTPISCGAGNNSSGSIFIYTLPIVECRQMTRFNEVIEDQLRLIEYSN